MDMKVNKQTSVDLNSLVNSHEKPFVVIDKNYLILAVNEAYKKAFHTNTKNALGKTCYQVSHGKQHPCHLDGEDCPHKHIFKTGKAKACKHIHIEKNHHMQQIKISAYPLRDANNELLLGECLEQTAPKVNRGPNRERMVGNSFEFRSCIEQLNMATNSDAPVLLQGETGTGKELAAEYIHTHSSRSNKPFQIVDSTVLTEHLFESEIFGHVNGAFTGSVGTKQGLFDMAEGGTLFLDEIGDMPIVQQAKLLRVLETGEYRPVGGKNMHKADVRIICATNRDLWQDVLDGTFRQDMYYRIACLNIRMPNLRERLYDIPVISEKLLEDINRTMHSNYYLMPDALEHLKTYHYPGNIRELRNILYISATQSKDHEINAERIDLVIHSLMQNKKHKKNNINLTNQSTLLAPENTKKITEIETETNLKSIEKYHIKELMELHQGNRRHVANALGISERTIYRKIKRLGIA